MEAIILAGGFGTLLRHIESNVSKSMAPIKGKPFLEYILDDLKEKRHKNLLICLLPLQSA